MKVHQPYNCALLMTLILVAVTILGCNRRSTLPGTSEESSVDTQGQITQPGKQIEKEVSEEEAIETARKAMREKHPRFRILTVEAKKDDKENRWWVFFQGDPSLHGRHMLVELSLKGEILKIHKGR